MTAILLEDIQSKAKAGKVYGKKGDRVTITADFVNVAIVKDNKGEKFAVPKDKLTYEN